MLMTKSSTFSNEDDLVQSMLMAITNQIPTTQIFIIIVHNISTCMKEIAVSIAI